MSETLDMNAEPDGIAGSGRTLTKPGIHSYNRRRRTSFQSKMPGTRKRVPWLRLFFLLIGLAGLGYYGYTTADEYVYQKYQNWAFDQQIAGRHVTFRDWVMSSTPLGRWAGYVPPSVPVATVETPVKPNSPTVPRPPHGSLIGRVAIPRLNLSAVVREGVDEETLRRAVGHVPSTQLAGTEGNFAIAAHRDTLFRALKDIKIGDRVAFEAPGATYDYRVISTQIVKPSDVSVLKPQGDQKLLTMITCYPFYYVGSAPKRFIVTARLDTATPVARTADQAIPAIANSPPVDSAQRHQSKHPRQTASELRHHRSSSHARTRTAQQKKNSKRRFWHKVNPFRKL